ncbi:hypothetical protein BKA70DRAFT_1220718 [Coprinopsis sp. MPI-PUGE-AT-0042]|nr:hypothetical protein BKA70DRAFT_1220718 [Coprinopsis sp. MPI-PUGE-AT-0042]
MSYSQCNRELSQLMVPWNMFEGEMDKGKGWHLLSWDTVTVAVQSVRGAGGDQLNSWWVFAREDDNDGFDHIAMRFSEREPCPLPRCLVDTDSLSLDVIALEYHLLLCLNASTPF